DAQSPNVFPQAGHHGREWLDWWCHGAALCSVLAGELLAPARQTVVRVRARLRLVHDAVHLPAEGVDRVHGIATVRGKEEERVVEIAAATLGERGAVGLRFLTRHGDGIPADQWVM